MSATREQDEVLLRALRLVASGRTVAEAARIVRRDASNLSKALRTIFTDDLEHDDVDDVLAHYPATLSIRRVK